MIFGSCHYLSLFSNIEAASQREKATSKVDVGRSVDLFPELNSGSCCEDSCFESHSGCSQQFYVYDFIFTAVHILILELLVQTQKCAVYKLEQKNAV